MAVALRDNWAMVDDKSSERLYNEAFRERLKSIRLDLDWSQAQMAAAPQCAA